MIAALLVIVGWFLGDLILRYFQPDDFLRLADKLGFVFLFFVGFAGYLRSKYDGLSGHDGLNYTEQQRLGPILEKRQRKLNIYMVIFIVVAICMIVFWWLSGSKNAQVAQYFRYIVSLMCALTVATIYLFIDMIYDNVEVNSFKHRLDSKNKIEAEKQKILSRLNG